MYTCHWFCLPQFNKHKRIPNNHAVVMLFLSEEIPHFLRSACSQQMPWKQRQWCLSVWNQGKPCWQSPTETQCEVQAPCLEAVRRVLPVCKTRTGQGHMISKRSMLQTDFYAFTYRPCRNPQASPVQKGIQIHSYQSTNLNLGSQIFSELSEIWRSFLPCAIWCPHISKFCL